ncbi:MAG TPA: inositol monophosphatase family protein, partial [Solirubrobacteraceae bacterium]|nr:inositol monophosphatase family protein [Solirubrobacteraceae bacterium]
AAGSGTLELAWVAAGRLHAWAQADTEPWDWHPGALLVSEAGGVARVRGRWHVAAAGERLADEVEALVRE